MTIVKKCRNCHRYFPGQLLSLEIYCPKCNSDHRIIDLAFFHLIRLKKNRSASLDLFDVYDSERIYKPWPDHKYEEYERVCRICGGALRKKDGQYSWHLRYCKKHRGYGDIIYKKYNWGGCSKAYIKGIQFKYRKRIKEKINELSLLYSEIAHLVVICEECNTLCLKEDLYYYSKAREYKDILNSLPIINVHHKVPVHTLTIENIYLIWDPKNLICLCPECHHAQDHLLSSKKALGKLFIKAHKTLEKFI